MLIHKRSDFNQYGVAFFIGGTLEGHCNRKGNGTNVKGIHPLEKGKWRVNIMVKGDRITKVCYSLGEAKEVAKYIRTYHKLEHSNERNKIMWAVNKIGRLYNEAVTTMEQNVPTSAMPMIQNGVSTFTFPVTGQGVRIIEKDGEPWFVAKDVAGALEYPATSIRQPNNLFKNVPDCWKGLNPLMTLGGVQNMLTISEQGLYFFLGRSDKPKALPCQMWLAGEVLPAIRRTGGYMVATTPATATPTESQEILMARALCILRDTLDRTEATLNRTEAQLASSSVIIENMTPKAECFSRFLDAKGSITLTEAAKHFCMTAQELGTILRSPKVKWLFKNMQGHNMPTKPVIEKGYMRVITRANSQNGYIAGQGRITPKGMDALQVLLKTRCAQA